MNTPATPPEDERPPTRVKISERGGRWHVQLVNGTTVTWIGKHTSIAAARAQAAEHEPPPAFVPKGKRRAKTIACRRCAADVELSVGTCERCGWAVAEATEPERRNVEALGTLLDMTTTPASKTTKRTSKRAPSAAAAERANSRRKTTPKLTIVSEPVEPKPARKRAAKSPATGESVVETHPLVGSSITIEQVDQLAQLAELARASAVAFEAYVCDLVDAGASPTHVGKACDLGNSAVRRIVMRRDAERPAKIKS
jgi:hypothetical protein